MDGPAFHAAAAEMERLKGSRLLFAVVGGDRLLDRALGALVSAALVFRGTRSESQQRAIQEYARTGNQATAAERLGVTQQAVSDALIRSGFTRMVEVESIIHEVFAGYGEPAGRGAKGVG
jgi:methylphosphotriester-DNA--protein-cysteine methyltransferase